jgi:hypothetical protein
MGNQGNLAGSIQQGKASQQVNLKYEVTPDFVWVYTNTKRA